MTDQNSDADPASPGTSAEGGSSRPNPSARPRVPRRPSNPGSVDPRAKSISLWARVLLSCTAVAIVATTARVVQLKTAPEERLVGSMVRPNGQLVQQRMTEYSEPRGRIVDRAGRLLALDTVGGRLFIDVKDLYTDASDELERADAKARAQAKAEGRDEPPPLTASLDPISDLAVVLAKPLGVPAASIARPILAKVPPELHTLKRDMTPEEWKSLPRFVVLAENLTDDQMQAIETAKREAGPRGIVRGAHVQPKSVRVRPFEEMAASLIGKTGFDGNGQSGAEFRANKSLVPTPGRTVFFADNKGQVISVPANGHFEGKPGNEVRLSIDIVIQEAVERELDRTVKASNAGGGRCIVVDVDTGEVLAAYDTLRTGTGRSAIADDPGLKLDPALARLRWVTDPFEPGSIFKPFVWAWSLDIGKARRNETIPLPDGPLVVADGRARRTIREAHSSSYGTKSWADCLVKSVNAGMATVGMRMTRDEFQTGLDRFGFGRKTGIELAGETAGILPPKDEWTNKTRAQTSVSFGQGIAVTPLQLVHAFTAFCRDGSMVPLTIAPVTRGSIVGTQPAVGEAAALATREVMQDVITKGTGKKLMDELRFTAFGKSGTAQLVKREGGYYDDRYVSSFLLGAPFDRPKLAILVTIEDPDKKKGPHGGGALAGPCAARIMNEALEYIGVPTDGTLVYKEDGKDGKKAKDGEQRLASVD